MRTNEERIAALHRRASELKKERRNRRFLVIRAAAAVASLAAVLFLAFMMPGLSGQMYSDAWKESMNASIFAANDLLGYIVIAVVAFLLGIAVTVFCYHLKKWQKMKDEEEMEKEGGGL